MMQGKFALGSAIFASVLLHSLIIAGAFWGWNQSQQPKSIKIPSYVKAEIVKLDAQTQKKVAPKKQPKKIDMVAKRKEQERLKREQEKKRQAQIAKREAERKKKEETEKKAKALAEQKRLEQERIEQQRQEEQRRQDEARIQQEFEEALAEEDRMMQEQEYANEAQSYIALIQQRIENKFVPPPSARKGMATKVSIQLVPTGRLVSVNIIDGSGNVAFDRAARQAVLDVDEFPEVKDMPGEVFERFFRKFSVIIRPEGLRL